MSLDVAAVGRDGRVLLRLGDVALEQLQALIERRTLSLDVALGTHAREELGEARKHARALEAA